MVLGDKQKMKHILRIIIKDKSNKKQVRTYETSNSLMVNWQTLLLCKVKGNRHSADTKHTQGEPPGAQPGPGQPLPGSSEDFPQLAAQTG